jgi:predicted Zn-dependent protease with MMP-like domain
MNPHDITDEQFDAMITTALDSLPQLYIKKMQNVAIVIADEPTPEQREKLKLRCNQSLFGLYEGIPLTQRGMGYNLVLPDKITIFKGPIVRFSPNEKELQEQIRHTLWHEIAHHFGLDHARIHALEQS